jgi:pyrroline-5-carboxylate reductase
MLSFRLILSLKGETMYKLGFIGTGTMGKAIVKGIVAKGVIAPKNIMIYDIDNKKSAEISQETNVNIAGDLNELCTFSQYILLCIKPNSFETVLPDLKDYLKKGTTIVSIAAGVTTDKIRSLIGTDYDIIRTMPNTPLLVNEGMTVICAEDVDNKEKVDFIMSIFQSLGKVQLFPEDLMSDVIALTGSSPAYVYMFIDALVKGAQESGIDKETACRLGAQAVLGAARMVLETGQDPLKLKNDVCSPGGTTIEAVRVLEEKGFESIVIEAMRACTEKAYIIGGNKNKR